MFVKEMNNDIKNEYFLSVLSMKMHFFCTNMKLIKQHFVLVTLDLHSV